MKSTILQHYYNKIRVLLLRKNNYMNSHKIAQLLNISIELRSHFHLNSNLEKKKIALLLEFITGRKPVVKILPSVDSINRIQYVVSFSKKESIYFLYRFGLILLPQLRFFTSIFIFKNQFKNEVYFDLKDLSMFKEVNDNFELFSNYSAIKNLHIRLRFSTYNPREIYLLLNSFNIPCQLV